MVLFILHHHFRPGGVRRVIELATPALVAQWPGRIRRVVLASGEGPDATWLGLFRRQLDGTPVRVAVEPTFGYLSEQTLTGDRLQERLSEALMELLCSVRNDSVLVWAHNLGVGRNLYLSRELTFHCGCVSIPLVVHHHDWWFENRWHHFAALREPGFRKLDAIAQAVFGHSRWIRHVAINQADASVLERHFPVQAAWLPNPVSPGDPPAAVRVREAGGWLRDRVGEDAPVWLLPARLLRRKNVAEALLLTRWLRPEAWLVTTGGVSSAEEQAYGDALAEAARVHGWRLRLGVLAAGESTAPAMSELMAASEAVLLTSLQEGFGLPYLEAVAARRPLLARRVPSVAPDLVRFGFRFPHLYSEIRVDPSLFDWEGERRRQAEGFHEWTALMPRAVHRWVGKPALLAAGETPCPVPFSRLTLTAQLEVLAQPVEVSWQRCAPLNRFLPGWRERARTGRLEGLPWPRQAGRWLSGDAFARRFIECVGARAESLSENSEGCCFRRKGWMARRDEGSIPVPLCGMTEEQSRNAGPDGPSCENPPGGGSFGRGRCWLGPYSPLRGCSGLAALSPAKTPRRSAPRSFQTGSQKQIERHRHLAPVADVCVRCLDPVRVGSDYVAMSMDYPVVLKKSEEGYAVGCPALPGCWSQGATEEEALQNIRIAIQEYLDVLQEKLKDEDVRSVTVNV